MKNLTRPILLAAGFVAFASLPVYATVGAHQSIDSGASEVDVNTTPTTSDYNTVTDDTLIFDETLANDPMAEESMSSPPIAGNWDYETEAVPLDKNSELARNLKLHVSKNSALSVAGQNVQLLQQGDQVVLEGTVSTASEANYISKLVSQFSKDQAVVNQIQLADDQIADETMETF